MPNTWNGPNGKPAASRRGRAKPIDREGQQQATFMQWLQRQYPALWANSFHVPNGGHRNKVVAAKLKKEGVKAGVPDLWFMQARGAHPALVIEFKAARPNSAAVSKEQKQWLTDLAAQGFSCHVAKGIDEAQALVRAYMALPDSARPVPVGALMVQYDDEQQEVACG